MPEQLQEIVASTGNPPMIDAGTIQKPNLMQQLSDRLEPALQYVSNNYPFNGLDPRKSKQGFKVHRATAFLPQE
ncbi:hypothetical protein PI124_g21574 [Phytophthora idaei]|nr:hypothetical protein PI125_g23278 [Phytophthora idaei]KAG3128633.1 hypothetical protein PI126_g21316 [Phytophthora idaei]KAG3233352.1 hypothetical protein PI124_g21574 [Phytophthora idaei]